MTKIHKDTGNTRKFLEGIHKVDKLFCPSISNFIWILSSDTITICQLNQIFSNSEAAMLSNTGLKKLPEEFKITRMNSDELLKLY